MYVCVYFVCEYTDRVATIYNKYLCNRTIILLHAHAFYRFFFFFFVK